MKTLSLALVLFFSALSLSTTTLASHASSKEFNPACHQQPNLVGGWTKTSPSQQVTESLMQIMAEMNLPAGLKKVTDVRSQVVNGTNYAVEFELENGQVWHVTFYRSLREKTTVTEPAHRGFLCNQ
ncbi:cystatin domain-containing protein [Vibrio sonorensis]|uniref:cystatin domain-containing protein n=1 Tax=Vibrio sonorensis TaxID=1004316 RepID=UPI0008DAC05A|nr:cystatin domain-containing protein [Vibrio sonorensis]